MSLNSWWLEDEGHNHKYDPIPEDPPQHKKKARKKRVRSDHKHDYETVCVDTHSYVYRDHKRVPYLYLAERCRICGRIRDVKLRLNMSEPPDGMTLYEVGWDFFATSKFLPEERKVHD